MASFKAVAEQEEILQSFLTLWTAVSSVISLFTGKAESRKGSKHSSTSSFTAISTREIQEIVNTLSLQRFHSSTRRTYHRIRHLFNQFFIRLDHKPFTWEDRLILFTGFLVDNKLKSCTVKSYISAIRAVLMKIGVSLSEDKYLLSSLT